MSENTTNAKKGQFRINRANKLRTLYSDEESVHRRLDEISRSDALLYHNAKEVRKVLRDAVLNRDSIVKVSSLLYAVNPIYAQIINYLSNMFLWRYKVTPHKVFRNSKVKDAKDVEEAEYLRLYHLMLEVVDGLSIETKFPSILTYLFIGGSVYLTTFFDEETYALNTILLPAKYCRKIGDTQYGTAIISFDFSFFDDICKNQEERDLVLSSYPKEFRRNYAAYEREHKSQQARWRELDPRFSSGLLLNDQAIPTEFYLYSSLLDYEQYQDNELERNENLLKYVIVQTVPHYEDKLIFEVDEVQAMQQSLEKKLAVNKNVRVATTYGDIHVERIAEDETTANEVLDKSYKTIFNNGGFNSALFNGESVQALNYSILRDRSQVWRYVSALTNFYTIALNNYLDFKNYQLDIEILPISSYTFNDDINTYRQNATLGVGRLDFMIASGIKQKNIEDTLKLEKILKLEEIKPMQTSYTQTASDRDTSVESRTSAETSSSSKSAEKSEKDAQR